MKCSSCGKKIWISHGSSRVVICKNCFNNRNRKLHTPVYFQDTSTHHEETPFDLKGISFDFEETPSVLNELPSDSD